MMRSGFRAVIGVLSVVAAVGIPARSARAVLLYGSATRNTAAPTGSLAGSGWQYQGQWGAFLGTPIAPTHFVTAEHVGGGVGQPFYYNGGAYTTTAVFDDPNSDLRIWQVDRPFDAYAPIYRGAAETGKQIVMFGRGTQRGADVTVRGARKGWQWGAPDGAQSWGANVVSTVLSGGRGEGSLLRATFDAKGVANEGTPSAYDSGGGDFVNDNGVWKLAGVNYSVDGNYSLTGTTGSGFSGSMFDQGGLYVGADGAWQFQRDAGKDVAGGSYLTRISSNQAWIDSVINAPPPAATFASAGQTAAAAVPEPGTTALVGAAVALLATGRRRAPGSAPR
jgi:hypothetical protein